MQKLVLIGSIGQDCTVTTNDKISVLNFSIAVNKRVKENSEWVEKTNWYRVAIFRNAETLNKISPYLTKGIKVYVAGDFETSMYNEKPQITLNAIEYELLTFNKK